MLDPVAMYNDIMNRILDRIPGGDAFRRPQAQARVQQGVRETGDTTAQETAKTGQNAETTADNTVFSSLVRQFEQAVQRTGGIDDDDVRTQINREIAAAAERHGLDAELIRAVVQAESNFRPNAVSLAGAMGLMQLMPGTAASLGVTDPFNIAQNINGGSLYLRRMLDLFDGDTSLALAAYNAGAGAVQRHGGIPPFSETQAYVPRVQQFWERNLLDLYRASTRFG